MTGIKACLITREGFKKVIHVSYPMAHIVIPKNNPVKVFEFDYKKISYDEKDYEVMRFRMDRKVTPNFYIYKQE